MQSIFNLKNAVTNLLSGKTKILEVPYFSQEGFGSHKFANDCGSACAKSVLTYYGKPVGTIDQLSSMTTLAQHDNGLVVSAVVTLLAKFGVGSTYTKNVTIDKIKNEIDEGRPVIALINYGYIARQNIPDHFGHYVTVCGYDDLGVIILDSDYWGKHILDGNKIHHPYARFSKSLVNSPAPNVCIFMNKTRDKNYD